MKRHGIVAAAALFLLAGCGDADGDSKDRTPIRVGDALVRAEIADDKAELSRGLGGRDRLARDAGMYFVLTDDTPRIWMKGMRFPLDLVWINDGRVVDLTSRVPNEPSGTPTSELPIYSPSQPANRVLEVNAGWAQRNGVRRGDRVRLGSAASG